MRKHIFHPIFLSILGVGLLTIGGDALVGAILKPEEPIDYALREHQLESFKHNHFVYLSSQACNHYEKNDDCPWDITMRYHVDSTLVKNQEFFAYVSNVKGEQELVNFNQLRISNKDYFPHEFQDSVKIQRAKYLAPGSFFEPCQLYPYYRDGEKIVILDELGNQVALSYTLLGEFNK